jgi:hypothetical protein
MCDSARSSFKDKTFGEVNLSSSRKQTYCVVILECSILRPRGLFRLVVAGILKSIADGYLIYS